MNVGSIIAGKFRIERVIGRGAMGIVVQATDLTLGRHVAVKLILPQWAGDAQLRGRFIREAHAMTRLHTEHVAQVLEVGELEDGMLFMAMEYLEGQSLDAMISSAGPLPVPDAVDLILEALAAVAEAHDLGFVHRDIKPSNLFLTARNGRPPILKVLDFGIVKDTTSQTKLTVSGTLPGTPAYMAPEQVACEYDLIDARVDVWAIGVTLYELLTGELPFNGPLEVMLARIRMEAPPRLRARRPDVAPELEAIVARCLSKHPADRFANAGELAAALADLRTRGLVRTGFRAERQPVETAGSIARGARRPRETPMTLPDAFSEAGSQGTGTASRGGFLPFAMLIIVACVLVGLVLALKKRGALFVRPPATQPAAAVSMTLAPSFATEAAASVMLPSTSPPPTISVAASVGGARRGARHVRFVSARNTGDHAWHAWVERHRQRIEGCAAQQTCPVGMSVGLSRVDGKTVAALQGTPADGACRIHPSLLGCMNELVKEPVPPLDVCTDKGECHADVLLAFE